MNFILKGINESAAAGEIDLSNNQEPDGKYLSLEVHGAHRVQIYHIPGKDKRDITMRTSDLKTFTTGPLWDRITVVQRCVSLDTFNKCKKIFSYGGPFEVTWAFSGAGDSETAGSIDKLYCIDGTFRQGAGYAEPDEHFYLDDGSSVPAFVGEWTLQFCEYND